MSNDPKAREQIDSETQFERLLRERRRDYTNCDFRFPVRFCVSLGALAKEGGTFSFAGAIFFEDVDVTAFGELFRTNLSFIGATFKKKARFSSVAFEKTVEFDRVVFNDDLEISNCTFQDIEIISPSVKAIILVGNKIFGKFKLSQNDELQYEKPNEKVKVARLSFMNNAIRESALVRLGYLDVGEFYFWNIRNPASSEINIGECNFKSFAIHSLRNAGKFSIYKINVGRDKGMNETLIISNSSFGDGEFQNVNLGCYKNVFMSDNLFSDFRYTGVRWPDKIETEEDDTEKKKTDTYRVLKNVAQQNLDAPQALEFYAKEMEAYSRTLSGVKGRYTDKFILHYNRLTNGFGLRWIRPVGWILGCGIVLYALLLWSLDLNVWNPCHWDKIPVFFNPTHKAEFIENVSWSFLPSFVDFIFRIIEVSLIYQAIIAFRKFTRKL